MNPLAILATDCRVALRNILRQTRRSLIAILAVGFGVVAMMLAAGFIEWLLWANQEGIAVTQFGHIQIVRPGYHDYGRSNPFAYLLPQETSALSGIATLPEVRSIAPRLDFNGLISHGENTISFIGQGLDPVADPAMTYLIIVDGDTLSANDPKGILLGAGLAANLGVKVGDSVVLLTSTRSGGLNAVEARVRGLASTSIKALDDTILRVPIDLARQVLRTTGAHTWVVSLKDTATTTSTVKKLSNYPSLRGFEVVPWTKLADFHNKAVALLDRQVNIVKLIIAIIIVLSISNTMTMSVMERTVEIGTVMALGLTRNRILGMFLVEGGTLGILAGTVGIIVGYIVAVGISLIGIPMPPAPGMSRGFIASILITPPIVVNSFFLAVVSTLLASFYPAWRASQMVIVDALRHNR